MKRAILSIILILGALQGTFAQGISLKTVVIDAGHGGKDPGAVSKDNKTFEKNFTLDIATRLARKIKIAYPDVKVVMTRSKDEFISLNERAERANRANADLFISIHINASPSSSPHGYSMHVLGQSSIKDRDLFAFNMNVCKRENSVILLEDDYTAKYQGFDPNDPESYIFMQLMQNAYLEQSLVFAQTACDCLEGGPISSNKGIWQNPFYVLWKTSMPAVLVELGFISNAGDLAVLKSESGRDKIAAGLCTAFGRYKASYDRSVSVNAATDMVEEKVITVRKNETVKDSEDSSGGAKPSSGVASESAARKTSNDNNGQTYGTQIFAVSRILPDNAPEFLGYKSVMIKAGSLNKYIIGTSTNLEEARKSYQVIRKKYPESYIVKITENGTVKIK